MILVAAEALQCRFDGVDVCGEYGVVSRLLLDCVTQPVLVEVYALQSRPKHVRVSLHPA